MYFNEKMPPWLQIFCKWLLILLFAAFASCSQENKPEKLLTEDEIVRAGHHGDLMLALEQLVELEGAGEPGKACADDDDPRRR